MIINISDNNVEKIRDMLRQNPVDCVVLVDYTAAIESFLPFITEINPGVKKIFCFTDGKPALKAAQLHSEIRKWSIADYIKFLISKKRVQFDHHQPVYDGDESRISGWRLHYAMGPLRRVSNRLHRLIPCTCTTKPVDYILATIGLAVQILIPPLRRQKGHISFQHGQAEVSIFFDGGPEKDHYGESPVMDEKLAAFENVVIAAKDNRMGFFIVTGPRHQFIDRVLALEARGELRNFVIFAAALFRPEAAKIAEKHKTGFFSKGSNLSIANKIVYSDHCLSIGAGDKELWFYQSKNAHD